MSKSYKRKSPVDPAAPNGSSESNPSSASDDEKQTSETEHRLALDNLTLTIEAGQKVALCGRTGRYVTQILCLRLRRREACMNRQRKKHADT